MNKTFTKTMIAGLACLAFCGTLTAAPGLGNGGQKPQQAPAHQQAARPGQNGGRHAPEPNRHCEPARHCAPVAHHAPAPPPPPPPPPEPHHGRHCNGAGLAVLGATVAGGIVGGIVGACL